MGEKRNAYRILMGKPEGKRPLERSGYRWEDNIKIDRREIKWGDLDGINLTQAFVNAVMNIWVIKCRKFLSS
jgi:hypothetical protein